jgi:hypothetical protein
MRETRLIIMENIGKRIEVQRATSEWRDDGKAALNKALEWLESQDADLLINAWGAKRECPALSERASAARQALPSHWRREYPWARLVAARRFEHSRYLHHAIFITLAQCCSTEELELVHSGLCRTEQGSARTAQKSAAVHTHILEMERLGHLAGFELTPELEALGCRAAGGDR